MSDPYIPPRGDTHGNPTGPVGSTMSDRGADAYRNDLNSNTTKPVRSGGGGFGTGALVAMVFVVVAIIAAVMFSSRSNVDNDSGVAPASTTVPDAGGTAAPGTMPDSTPDATPAPVEPDTAPDLVPKPAPGGATPDTAAPATP